MVWKSTNKLILAGEVDKAVGAVKAIYFHFQKNRGKLDCMHVHR